jgi:hypothetical protein
MQPEPEFVTFVRIDRADQKHVWCLQAANSAQQENGDWSISGKCWRHGQ